MAGELSAGEAGIVVVGAGPQALCLCAQLLRKRPRWRRHLRGIDPAGGWLSSSRNPRMLSRSRWTVRGRHGSEVW
jgi:hypothetical protein